MAGDPGPAADGAGRDRHPRPAGGYRRLSIGPGRGTPGPAAAAPARPGQICGHLPALEQAYSSRETRDRGRRRHFYTGRRPAEICTLEWDCLARDADGTPVLVYDNSKAHRLHRRLPISEHTATLITDQKLAVRERFPATPPAQLKLLPSRRLNPIGIPPDHRGQPHRPDRIWLSSMGPLLRADSTEYDKTLITPYSYRHLYAYGHADAGVPIDVLRELMDHTSMDATKRYFRVGETRRRQAAGQSHRDAVRPARQPRLARRRPPRCWTASTPGTRSARSLSLTEPAASRPT